MFLGPLEAVKPWSEKGIEGVHRFLRKVHRECLHADKHSQGKEDNKGTLKVLHETILKVTEAIEDLRFNVAISQMMILINHLKRVILIPLKRQKYYSTASPFRSPFSGRTLGKAWRRSLYCESTLATGR